MDSVLVVISEGFGQVGPEFPGVIEAVAVAIDERFFTYRRDQNGRSTTAGISRRVHRRRRDVIGTRAAVFIMRGAVVIPGLAAKPASPSYGNGIGVGGEFGCLTGPFHGALTCFSDTATNDGAELRSEYCLGVVRCRVIVFVCHTNGYVGIDTIGIKGAFNIEATRRQAYRILVWETCCNDQLCRRGLRFV